MLMFPRLGLSAIVLAMVFASGCTESNEGFRTFRDSDAPLGATATVATETAVAPDSPTASSPGSNSPTPAQTDTSIASTESPRSSAAPPLTTPAPQATLTPPAPPAAEAIQQVSATIPTRKIEVLIPEKSFKVVGPENAIRVSFDDLDLLKVLNADPVPLNIEQSMPAWLLGLTGTRVRIRGFMYPPNRETELPAFMMVRDSKDCCFGRNVLIYDKIGVRMRDGVTTDYIQLRPFDVVGVMTVKARISDGKLMFLYMIEDAIVVEG